MIKKRIFKNDVFHILENTKVCILIPHSFISYHSYPLCLAALKMKGHEGSSPSSPRESKNPQADRRTDGPAPRALRRLKAEQTPRSRSPAEEAGTTRDGRAVRLAERRALSSASLGLACFSAQTWTVARGGQEASVRDGGTTWEDV